ncbi:TonB-dependent receptor [Sphingomonas aerophila]|uniref:Iron complex outermembrane receptor protein n=1 Tax=Sphingomonas aerophila TaxID=1344948 RepID=A0A7W9BCC9_9SPHN|nr:iron complex outermembrane receptor protein [Sphingomonas aerophila]
MPKTLLLKSVLLLGIASLPSMAAAQTAQPGPDHAQAQDIATGDAQTGELTDVVVTAERRSENLQRVPVSVAVVGGGDLRSFQAAGEDILALSGRVPGLYAETTTGRIFPRFYIRGLGNVDFYLGASQPVSIIQDDVVLEHVVLKSNPVFDVNQVEVLRGPQGSLFGRNTTAGIIKFDTIRPSQTLKGRATASYGELNTATFDAGIGGPIVADKIAVRLSALVQHRENWIDNSFSGVSADGTAAPARKAMGGFDDRNVRLQVLLTPSDRVSVNVSAHARDYDGTSTLFHRNALRKGSKDASAEPRDRVAYDEAQNNPQAYNTYGGSVNSSIDFGPVTLTSISAYETTSGYSRGDTDGGAAANFPFNGVPNGFGQSQGNIRDLDQYTQEVRLASPADQRFTWQVGGFYFNQTDVTDFYQRAFFLTGTARNPNNWVRLHDANTSWAVFGQASFKITPDFIITAGARETDDTKKTDLVKTANTAANLATYTGRRHVRLSDTTPSWDLSALYQVDPANSVYARVARGFRGPTIQGRSAVFNADFTTANSETITSYEVGSKGTYFDNRLRLNAALFTYTVKDIQLNGNDTNGNGVLFNADKARAWGVELDAEYRPFRNLTLTAGASALRSKIKDKRVYAQACGLNGVLVCTVLDPYFTRGAGTGRTYFASIDGNPLPNAPKWTLDATARYDLPLKDDSSVFLAADGNIQGYTNFVLYKTREFYADGNFELGLRVGYAAPGGDWEVSAFARNLTNEKNLKGVIENYMAAVFNEPRVIGVSLSGKIR